MAHRLDIYKSAYIWTLVTIFVIIFVVLYILADRSYAMELIDKVNEKYAVEYTKPVIVEEEAEGEVITLYFDESEALSEYVNRHPLPDIYMDGVYIDGLLTKSGGVNYYEGRRETWYSQRVLPGGGLDIPGRHADEYGIIRDEWNYICVAAEDLPYGSIVNTSLGVAKVYDSGCPIGTTDIYVDW